MVEAGAADWEGHDEEWELGRWPLAGWGLMANGDEPEASEPPASDRDPVDDTGFERWLRQRLNEQYTAVLDEPLPDDLAQLIAQFAPKPGPDDGPTGQGEPKP